MPRLSESRGAAYQPTYILRVGCILTERAQTGRLDWRAGRQAGRQARNDRLTLLPSQAVASVAMPLNGWMDGWMDGWRGDSAAAGRLAAIGSERYMQRGTGRISG